MSRHEVLRQAILATCARLTTLVRRARQVTASLQPPAHVCHGSVPDIDPDKHRLVVYALTTYLLAGSKPISESDVINAQTLPKVRMPNRDNFIIRFRERI